jgi:hypothetical protein
MRRGAARRHGLCIEATVSLSQTFDVRLKRGHFGYPDGCAKRDIELLNEA